jgi:uncharacterized protein (AIM24 family)
MNTAFRRTIAQYSLSMSAFSSCFAQETSQPQSGDSTQKIEVSSDLNDASIGYNRPARAVDQSAAGGESPRMIESELPAKSGVAGQAEVAADASGLRSSQERDLQRLAKSVAEEMALIELKEKYQQTLIYFLALSLTVAAVVSSIAALRIATWFRFRKLDRLIARGAQSTDQSGDEQTKPTELKHSINVGTAPSVSITLPPGASVVGQSGCFWYAGAGVKRELVTGQSQGFSRTPVGLIKRILIGESWRFLKCTNTSNTPQEVGLSPSQMGTLVHVDLKNFPGGLCADGGAFFACGPQVTLAIQSRAGIMGGFSGLGLFQQKFNGDGEAFLFARGDLKQLDLKEGEAMMVDSGALFMWEPTVIVTLEYQGLFAALTGGEGLFLCKLTGHGKVYLATRGSEDDTSSNRSTGLEKWLEPITRWFT